MSENDGQMDAIVAGRPGEVRLVEPVPIDEAAARVHGAPTQPRRRLYRITDWGMIQRTAADVETWGYPRQLIAGETEGSIWLRWGPDCIIWLNWGADDFRDLLFHIIVKPESRGKISARRVFLAAEVVASLEGARSLVAILRDDQVLERRICRRLGWEPDKHGHLVKDLGEE